MPGPPSESPFPAIPKYALVTVDRGAGALEHELTYGVPEDLGGNVKIGQAFSVTVKSQRAVGYVTGFTDRVDFDPAKLKSLGAPLLPEPLFDAVSLKLARWMAAYYHCPLADCLACFIPAGMVPSTDARYKFESEAPLAELARSPKLLSIAEAVKAAGKPMTARAIGLKIGARPDSGQLKRLTELGVLSIAPAATQGAVRARMVSRVKITPRGLELLEPANLEKLAKSSPRQAAALRELATSPHEWVLARRLFEKAAVDLTTLRALRKRDAVEWRSDESLRAPVSAPRDGGRIVLNEEQLAAVAAIDAAMDTARAAANQEPTTVLLQGVTASGKTEVYLAAIEHCLHLGRRALVLVPEIALTAQTVDIFQGRFGSRVAILHSALSVGERFDEWRRAGRGDAQIVVGARSAIFAPCRDVGLIIIDEEHDHSYKQDATPRYNARDVAARRAALDGAVVVLGSATPSLESYVRATRGEYRHVVMTKRVAGRALPEVQVVDMTDEARGGKLPVLSKALKDELCATVARGEQAILFLNRRGFATYVQCLACGHVERCPNCDVSLTHHRGQAVLRCHHCDFAAKVPDHCPRCDGWLLAFSGSGTEKVEEAVEELWKERGVPGAPVLRLDRDTTAQKGAHGRILGAFRKGEAGVLIGTQMVTKGLDFPRVTLVGVISADSALNVPDFRAAERTFQLLSQVAGRAGRGESPGMVLIQTLTVDDIAINAACAHDFAAFVESEMAVRAAMPNPPFAHIVNIVSYDEDQSAARDRLKKLEARFQLAIAQDPGTEVLGPVDCPIARVKNQFRYHLLLRDRSRPRLHRILRVYDELPRDAREGLTVDVDAMTIL